MTLTTTPLSNLTSALNSANPFVLFPCGESRPIQLLIDHASTIHIQSATSGVNYAIAPSDIALIRMEHELLRIVALVDAKAVTPPNASRTRPVCIPCIPRGNHVRESPLKVGDGWYVDLKLGVADKANVATLESFSNAIATHCNGGTLSDDSALTIAEKAQAVVLVNPIAGSGSAMAAWKHVVEPILRSCDLFDFTLHVTQHKGHGFDIGKIVGSSFGERRFTEENPLYVVTLGGDGLMYELVNGIRDSRPKDWEEVMRSIAWSALPCGSGNGLSLSSVLDAAQPVAEPFGLLTAMRQLLRRKSVPKDLGLIHLSPSGEFDDDAAPSTRLFALTVSWGLVADIDVNSESLRKIAGEARFTWYGLWRILKRPLYAGHLRWVPEDATVPGDGDEIASDFVSVYVSLVPAAAKSAILRPSKPLNDGYFDIFRFRGNTGSRKYLLDLMDELSKVREHSAYLPEFEAIRTKEFELIPEGRPVRSSAGIVVDGEQVTSAAIRVGILPSATRMVSSAPVQKHTG